MRISDRGSRAALVVLWMLCAAATVVAASSDWSVAVPDYAWEFPRDHWAHPDYKLEWWYFTGHLAAAGPEPREFGYQVTIFRIGLHPRPLDYDSAWTASNLWMGHFAVTDKNAGEHRFSEVLYRASPLLAGFNDYPDPEIAWSRGPIGTDSRWTLRWNGEGYDFSVRDDHEKIALELSTTPRKPLVFQGPNGYSRKAESAGAASQYYSMTRLATRGTLTIDGEPLQVAGSSWMDKEFSTSNLDDEQVGWDWFSLQLDDGRELMLYLLRREDGGPDFGRGTVIDPAGGVRWLEPADWSVSATGRWTSPETGADYPSGWSVEVPSEMLEVRVRPVVADQENVGELAGGLHYWEGAVTVVDRSGRRIGRGYVELTGYGEGNRPPV